MDLVATVARKAQNGHREGQVDVWRLNGQRVFGAEFECGSDDDDDANDDNDNDKDQDQDQNETEVSTGPGLERNGEGWIRGLVWRRDGEF